MLRTMDDKTIKYKRLERDDLNCLTALTNLYNRVFDMKGFMHPGQPYLKGLLDRENIIFYVALSGGEVVAGLTAYILPSVYFPTNEAYIYDLAVKTSLQRQGIGTQLMAAFKNYCKEQGYSEIFVQADFKDKHARGFYRSTGGQPHPVVQFTYSAGK